MDEMMMDIAKEYFAGMDKKERKELLHNFLDMLSDEEREEVLELVLGELAMDKKMLKRIESLLKERQKK